MHNEFTYVVEPPENDDPWFIAFCPEMPEANGQGRTEQEAIDSLKAAIAMVLDLRREEGLRGVSQTAKRGVVAIERNALNSFAICDEQVAVSSAKAQATRCG